MFGRDKKKQADSERQTAPIVIVGARLVELCGPDEEMYTALSRLLLLDPKRIVRSLETVVTDAQDYEEKGNRLRAEVEYRLAGGLSLWKGDGEGVRKYFAKASSFAGEARPEYKSIMKRADEAVSIAAKYYETTESPPSKQDA
jgi:hypothetical protein